MSNYKDLPKTVSFESFFEGIYGPRWEALRAALEREVVKPGVSLFAGHSQYVMDTASVIAAQALEIQNGHRILDMCAAPGGKTLIILNEGESQNRSILELVSNEMSFARRKRLEEVIRSHVPQDLRMKVRVRGLDAIQFGLREPASFDRVLLDAPCSSERHHIHAGSVTNEWTLSKTQSLGKRQYGLLCSGILALKVGGKVVYSTCSISPFENDEVVRRVLDRKGDEVQLDLNFGEWFNTVSGVEKTEFGFQIFPDRANGLGPIYFSRLVRIELEPD